MDIRRALQEGERLLVHGDSPRLDVELLLAAVLDKPRVHLYTYPERELAQSDYEAFSALCRRRAEGWPVAYLTGRRAFWNLELKVGPDVLIPRPETELLVELALELLPEEALTVADLGTGSGAIALALAGERPRWRLSATDDSAAALAVARDNAAALGLGNVEFRQACWREGLPAEAFDAIVSNPPYVAPDDPHLRRGDVRFEPRRALMADDDGLADIRHIADSARAGLKAGGLLLLEHGYRQGEAVRMLLSGLDYDGVATRRDPAGQERVTYGWKRK